MPRPSTQKQLLSLPFRTGLSQKQDERWLEPGAMLTAQNAVKQKTNTFQKRVGFSPIGTNNFSAGRNLGTIGGDLCAIMRDQWPDSMWTYNGATNVWEYVDQVPEVYAFPDRTVAGYDGVVREMDTACANGIEVHVWLYSPTNIPGNSLTVPASAVYFCVCEASTGRYILGPQPMAFNGALALPTLGTASPDYYQCAPKLIVQGGQIVFGMMAGQIATPGATTGTIYLAGLDTAQPANGFGSPRLINGVRTPTVFPMYTMADWGSWDICATPGAASGVFGVLWQGIGEVSPIWLDYCTTGALQSGGSPLPPTVISATNCTPNDALYVADVTPYVTAFALDVSTPNVGGQALLSYAYEYLGPSSGLFTLRVHVQTVVWQSLPSFDRQAIDLWGASTVPVPATGLGRYYPHAMALAEHPQTGGGWVLAFGPASASYDSSVFDPDAAYPPGADFTISWWFQRGVSVLANQQTPRVTFHCVPASRWLVANGIAYLVCRLISTQQGTYYLMAADWWQDIVFASNSVVSWFPMRLVATFAPRLSSVIYQAQTEQLDAAYIATSATAQLPYYQDWFFDLSGLKNFPQVGNYPHCLPHICANAAAEGTQVYQSLISVAANDQSQNPTVVSWDMRSGLAMQNAALGKNTGIAAGCPSLTDGDRVHEFAFPYYPQIARLTPISVVGGGLVGSTPSAPVVYQYIAIYDWQDAQGQLHRSGRSSPQAFSFNGTNIGVQYTAAQVIVTTAGFTAKEKALLASGFQSSPQQANNNPPVTVRLFRTQANGSLYYEVGSQQNIQGLASVVFLDLSSDAQIAPNRLLYNQGLDGQAQGSILDNLTPPAFQCLITHKNRYFGVDGNNVWASKELVDGEGAGFNELQAFTWSDGPGFITAITSLDDKLILWKGDRVAYVTGEGPEDDGGQNDWTPPTAIASDTGCIDWRSVVVTPEGVRFMSAAGYRILTRDLQVMPVPDVEDVLAGTDGPNGPPTITAATMHPTQGAFIVQMSGNTTDQEEAAGLAVRRDYILDSWTTLAWEQASGAFSGAVGAAVADVPIVAYPGGPPVGGLQPVYHFVTEAGLVYRENTGSTAIAAQYMDDAGANFVPTVVETAWVKSGGIENFARFRRLQVVWKNADPHALSVWVAYDYTPTWYPMGTVTAAQMAAQQNNPMCQELFSLPRQRAEAVRFMVSDAADATTPPVTGQGAILVSMGLEVATYTNSRSNRLPPTQRK